MKKIILLIWLFVFLINLSEATIYRNCSQEFANVSNSCGGLSTGNYSLYRIGYSSTPWNVYDGDWNTFDIVDSGDLWGYLYVNYSKPYGSLNRSIINYRFTNASGNTYFNSVLPQSCWNYNNEKIIIRAGSYFWGATNSSSTYDCYNGTWVNMMTNFRTGSLNTGGIYEENVTWNSVYQLDFRFNNTDGTSLSPTCSVTYGTLDQSYRYTVGNSHSDTLICTLEGYATLNENFNVNEGDKNYTLQDNQIILNFNLYNGTKQITNGYWTDSNRTQNFTSNNLTIAVTDLIEGRTNVYFGYNNSLFNFTQFYDFENSWVSSTTENLTVMTDTTVLNQIYIKVIDLNSNPLDDVLVRIAISNPATGGIYKEIGQRFTAGEGTNGLTYFYVPSNTDVSIRITKDGYTAKTVLRNVLSNEYTSSNPLTVKLERSGNIVNRGVFVMLPEYYNENITSITMQVYAPSRDSVTFATSHYPTTNYTITLNEYKQGSYTLIRGIHYCSNCTDAISFTFWVDGEEITFNSIPYIGFDLGKFNVDTGLFTDSTTGNSLLAQMAWIGIIILSGIIGIALRDQFEAQGIAKNIFMGLCLIISIIFVDELYFLGIVVGFYIIGMIVRKVYSE